MVCGVVLLFDSVCLVGCYVACLFTPLVLVGCFGLCWGVLVDLIVFCFDCVCFVCC